MKDPISIHFEQKKISDEKDLRDQFAGLAMKATIEAAAIELSAEGLADLSYGIADAMMRRRGKIESPEQKVEPALKTKEFPKYWFGG